MFFEKYLKSKTSLKCHLAKLSSCQIIKIVKLSFFFFLSRYGSIDSVVEPLCTNVSLFICLVYLFIYLLTYILTFYKLFLFYLFYQSIPYFSILFTIYKYFLQPFQHLKLIPTCILSSSENQLVFYEVT